jgi:hypothetical protein
MHGAGEDMERRLAQYHRNHIDQMSRDLEEVIYRQNRSRFDGAVATRTLPSGKGDPASDLSISSTGPPLGSRSLQLAMRTVSGLPTAIIVNTRQSSAS